MAWWRNGRRTTLKMLRSRGHEGSTPSRATRRNCAFFKRQEDGNMTGREIEAASVIPGGENAEETVSKQPVKKIIPLSQTNMDTELFQTFTQAIEFLQNTVNQLVLTGENEKSYKLE